MDTQALVMQLRYSAWASRRSLESVAPVAPEDLQRDLGSSYGGLYGTLAHIFQADAIWLDRLMDRPTTDLSAYNPPPQLAELSERWLAVLDAYVSWGEKLDDAGWDRIAHYRNTKGEPFQQPVWQIVLHIVNHATYHRGQITTMLRQIGRTPIGTDLIAYYREI